MTDVESESAIMWQMDFMLNFEGFFFFFFFGEK